ALYESLYSLFAFGLVWSLRKRIKAPVVLFGLFLVIHGTGRFLVEQIRINKQYDLFGLLLSQAEIISVGLILAGISVMLYYRRLGKNTPKPR
ncbi:MAG TPA: prolipoprotein diacylglyceryl transferase, partial [Bacteroidales bacterium]|nr:prolipoprotein diacylglyceryl transferase [Bacteroidales bacterium]